MSRRPYKTARERVAERRAAAAGQPPPRPSVRRRHRRRGPLLGLAALLGVLGLALGGLIWWAGGALRGIEQADARRPSNGAGTVLDLPANLREPFTVLLLGVDRRDPEDGVRADTLIVVYVHPAEGWAGMLSIPRDTMAQIPGVGLQKINTAYSYGYNNAVTRYGAGTTPEAGGAALAAETVAGFLNLELDYLAQVDFQGFERVVNLLNGITLDVERPLLDAAFPTEDYGYERIYIPAGIQTMDGSTALQFARSRHSSSDFDRAARQQQVLRAILDEARGRGLLNQVALLPGLVAELETSVATTLPLSDPATLRGLAALAQQLDTSRMMTLSLNPNEVRIIAEEGSNIYWDPADVAAQVARLTSGPTGEVERARIQVLNGAGVRGLAGRVSSRLEGQGFMLNSPADAPSPVERTILIAYGEHPETLRRLADTLGLDPGRVYPIPPADAPPPPYQTEIVLLLGADYASTRVEGEP
ncbi:MAG: LCP family protein [Oscillochloridaceae bacterium umkhey_bin13]